ncbi:hypothetical protein Trydic_g14779 [Trypoxylus dichotomus]
MSTGLLIEDIVQSSIAYGRRTRYPIVGTNYVFIGVPKEDLFDIMVGCIKEFRPIFRAWNGSTPEVHFVKPEHLEIIMNNPVHITKGLNYKYLHSWLGQGLLTSTGARWFQHRKLITPAFHFKILENFMAVFVENTEILLKILDSKATDKSFNIYTDITHCALDIICETAMGVNVRAMSIEENEYIKSIYHISEVILWKVLHPYVPDFIFKLLPEARRLEKDLTVLHGFSNKVISDRKKLLKKKACFGTADEDENVDNFGIKKRRSFLDLLLEASEGGNVLSDTDIREEVDTFMFAGHDTTTAAMSWTLLLLGNYPEVQEKTYEEIRCVLQDKSIPTTITELNELNYLERVIKESLRMFPIAPLISRHLQQDIKIDDYKIPANTQAILHVFGVHMSPEYYPDPEKFDPDRFLPENSIGRHPYAYIPFSDGPRNCIGQKFAMYEVKCILTSIINRYKITSVHKVGDVKRSIDIILRPHKGVFVEIKRR